ncbi:hypothetical protein [Klebsiella quasipneumoniae]|uniref:hypothetical protein n=1 Tax=Klebsiella quasipneumoniae TaxID=1463165 RepID=UPI00248158BD|nr:hypothetical protein [Klebsiella quasipneumoniae]HBQ9084922.1 hypothetical protein [Klebsiella quasipneumoniae]HBQ9091138.1 hypothetical protein [Klebsiella quasipneumoniae]HBQ9096429.1 hypothetical protein [Klebsiella quasipneumoniae]HBQ9112783.1 hypothetical protein [Klebsiella quasipneumoniae]HBV4082531.1 hypothetical protein [Klebsiella quasipneumoniae]
MGWLANRVDKWASKKQNQEISEFVYRLKSMDGAEIGLIVATATHVRHILEREGHNMMDPVVYTSLNPAFTFSLSQTVVQLQKEKNFGMAAAFMVWVHTFRSSTRGELRQYGREMWRELERGFPYVFDAAMGYQQLTGHSLDFYDAESFPTGLTPDPL